MALILTAIQTESRPQHALVAANQVQQRPQHATVAASHNGRRVNVEVPLDRLVQQVLQLVEEHNFNDGHRESQPHYDQVVIPDQQRGQLEEVTVQREPQYDNLQQTHHHHAHIHDEAHAQDVANNVPHVDDLREHPHSEPVLSGDSETVTDHGDHVHVSADGDHEPQHAHVVKDHDGFLARLLQILDKDTNFLIGMDNWNHQYHHHSYAA